MSLKRITQAAALTFLCFCSLFFFQNCGQTGELALKKMDPGSSTLSNGNPTQPTAQIPVADLPLPQAIATPQNLLKAKTIVSGPYQNGCAITLENKVKCWESRDSKAVEVPELQNVLEIAVSVFHFCARIQGNTVKCWGQNKQGALGNNTFNDSLIPVDVVGLTNVVQISVGGAHSCAITGDGKVKCWGEGFFGALGPAVKQNTPYPVEVIGIEHALQVEARSGSSCALIQGGIVKCWGFGLDHILEKTRPVPALIQSEPEPREIARSEQVSKMYYDSSSLCLLLVNSKLKCLGRIVNNFSNLVEMVEFQGLTQLGIGIDFCGLFTGGTVKCLVEGAMVNIDVSKAVAITNSNSSYIYILDQDGIVRELFSDGKLYEIKN